MVAFLEHLHVSTVEPDSDSDAEPHVVKNYGDPPQILVVAHNGLKFDFAILVSEVFRTGADWLPIQRWGYVDTLDVFRVSSAPCVKLQCLYRELAVSDGDLRAQRALDDAVALRDVTITQAERYGLTLGQLLAPFVVECDVYESMAQEMCLRLSRNQTA